MRAAIEWAARFGLDGPGWIPRRVRRLPMQLLVQLVRVQVLLGVHGRN